MAACQADGRHVGVEQIVRKCASSLMCMFRCSCTGVVGSPVCQPDQVATANAANEHGTIVDTRLRPKALARKHATRRLRPPCCCDAWITCC